MNGQPYNYPVETVRYGVSFGTALAIAISYVNNQSICGRSSTASSAGSTSSISPCSASSSAQTAYSTPTSSVPSGVTYSKPGS